jgi:hypothetical protein
MYRESIIVTFWLMMSGAQNATNHPPSSECEKLIWYISARANTQTEKLPITLVEGVIKGNPKKCRDELRLLRSSYTGPGVVVTSKWYRQNTLPIREKDIEYFLDGTLTHRSAKILSTIFLTQAKIWKVDDRVRESIIDTISEWAKRGNSHMGTMTEGEYLLHFQKIYGPWSYPEVIMSAFSYGRKIRDNISKELETTLPY